jgi:regulator of protease activity HflC (stomatin/prohibitin superfamily)
MNETYNTRAIKLIVGGIGLFIIFLLIIAFFPIVVVGAGERGVVFNNASGIESRILGEGTHLRIPFLESVKTLSVRTQTSTFDEAGPNSAGSQDSQQVDLKTTVNWHLDPAQVNRVYQSVGDLNDIKDSVLNNNVQDSIKAAVSKYQALDIQRNRDKVGEMAQALLQQKVKKYHIIIENLSLTNINFSNDFNAAVEAAQVAQQQAKKAEYEVTRVTNEATAAIAKAKGEAEAQRQVQQSLTPELLQKMWIEKWNGILPTTDLGNNIPTFILNK